MGLVHCIETTQKTVIRRTKLKNLEVPVNKRFVLTQTAIGINSTNKRCVMTQTAIGINSTIQPEGEDAEACLRASWEAQQNPGPPEGWGPCTKANWLTSQSCCHLGIQRWAQKEPATMQPRFSTETALQVRQPFMSDCLDMINT